MLQRPTRRPAHQNKKENRHLPPCRKGAVAPVVLGTDTTPHCARSPAKPPRQHSKFIAAAGISRIRAATQKQEKPPAPPGARRQPLPSHQRDVTKAAGLRKPPAPTTRKTPQRGPPDAGAREGSCCSHCSEESISCQAANRRSNPCQPSRMDDGNLHNTQNERPGDHDARRTLK